MPYVCYAQSAQYELLGESSAQTLDWRPEQSLQLHPYCCHERLLNDGFEERCMSGLFCIRYDCARELVSHMLPAHARLEGTYCRIFLLPAVTPRVQ